MSSSYHPPSIFEIWSLYIENYPSYHIRTKVFTLFRCDLDLLTPKCNRYLPLAILQLCMKYESCTLKTTQVIVSEPKCWRRSVVTLTCYPKIYRYLPLAILQLCMNIWKLYIENYSSYRVRTKMLIPKDIVLSPSASMYVIWKLYVENYSNYRVRTKMLTKFRDDLDLLTPKCIGIFLSPSCIYVWNMKAVRWNYSSYPFRTKVLTKFCCDLHLWLVSPKINRYLPLTILYLCMKYESCTLKTTQVILSEPNSWQSSMVTLTVGSQNVLISSSHRPSSNVWNMKAIRWKQLKLSCQNQSLDKVPLWPWPLTFWPQIVLKLSCQNQNVDKIPWWPWSFGPKMYRYLPLTILHLCMKYEAVHWKLLKLSCQNQSVDKVQLWPGPFDLFSFHCHASMCKYENCTLKTTQVIVSKPKCWQRSLVTLIFDFLIPNCVGIFLLPSCIYVWNMKTVHWKLLKLSCQNKSVDGQANMIPIERPPSGGTLITCK